MLDINEKLLNSQEKLIENQKENEIKLEKLQKNITRLKQNKIIKNRYLFTKLFFRV